jgi:DNA polymerase-3 subunit delta
VKNNTPPRLYLLAGDSFLIEEKRKAVCNEIRKQVPGELFERSCRLRETPLDEILKDARTTPFLASAQIFRITEAETLKKSDLEILSRYLENPPLTAYLIFESTELGAGSELAKLIQPAGLAFIADDRERKNASVKLIREKLARHGKAMSPEAVERLKEQAGDVPALLDSILEQVITYAGSEKEITEEMVERFEENWQEADIFKLLDALMSGRTDRALQIWNQLIAGDDQETYMLVGFLHSQLRRYWRGRSLLEQGASQERIMKECKVSPKQAPYFMRQINGYALPRLERAIESLFHLDWKSKTGRTEGPSAFESWVIQLSSDKQR